MRRGHEQVVDVVVVLEVDALRAFAAAFLRTVRGDRQALDVAGLRDGDDHVLVGDEVLDVDLGRFLADLGAARGCETLFDLEHLLFDDAAQEHAVLEHALEVGDALLELVQLVLDLLALQADQTAQAHLEDGLGLLFGKVETLDQAIGGLFVGLGRADDGDDLVDVVERHDEAFEDVGAFFGFRQLVARAPLDDFFLVLDVVVQHFLERQHARHAVDKCEHDDAEADLQLCVLEQLVDDDLRQCVRLELDDDVDALAIGCVVDVADLGKLLVAHELAELLEHAVAVDLVRDLGDDDLALAVLELLDAVLRTDGQ